MGAWGLARLSRLLLRTLSMGNSCRFPDLSVAPCLMQVLSTWASKSQPPKQVVYGATEILSGEEFLQQLGEVGKRSGAT